MTHCPECNQPEQYTGRVLHKLSCGSKSLLSAYFLLRDRDIHHFSDEMLVVLWTKMNDEIERRIEERIK
jgi:hypothetical protein